ncbi:MAG: histidine triad nucleotide-binding protein [Halobacteriovoraceae bacterium]|jgi:histidine triad (HIT) family protein|nr:histidine triad nucleotide-binding protein [Halobacteriovoraceae bacterium]MBT5092731.1 histidine triad nucleotide-binding protein [Halobacteriovoraceae bacterium]
MSDCLFCKIVAGVIPSEKVFENDKVLGFKDITPQAKVHALFIHKEHSRDINELVNDDPQQVTAIFEAINQYSRDQGLDNEGFRTVTNCGAKAGQSVFHTHFHVLSGSSFGNFGKI